MKRQIPLVLLLMFLIVGCQPSGQAVQTAIAQTQEAWTPTPIPATPTPAPVINQSELLQEKLIEGLISLQNQGGIPKDIKITQASIDYNITTIKTIAPLESMDTPEKAVQVARYVLALSGEVVRGNEFSFPESTTQLVIFVYKNDSDKKGELTVDWKAFIKFSTGDYKLKQEDLHFTYFQ